MKPDCRRLKCVALTFDDGPGAHTGRLLNTLKAKEVAATFFLVGNRVRANSALVQRMHREGHEIGNHSWDHPSLPALGTNQLTSQIQRTDAVIKDVTGNRPTLFRPPYGARDARVDRAANNPVILWDVDTLDWRYRDPTRIARVAGDDARPGSIILLHDIHSTTVAAVPALISRLRARGFTFVTVSDLYAPGTLVPGKVYRRG